MEKKNYVVAVDIGSSEVVVAIGSMTDSNIIHIEAIAREATEGMSAGLVDNSQVVSKALKSALERVESELGIKVTDAYATLSGKFVRSARYTDHVFVGDVENCISQADIRSLEERMHNVKAPDDEFIMDLYPIEYKNDNGLKLSRPVGAYSKQLSATYNFILCENSAKDRLRRVFINAGINLKGLYASGAIIAESLVSKDEKKDGVAIVDIGSGVTDIAVYYDNVLCHMTSLPIGGSAVNNDIHHFTTNLSAETVEKLKLKQGTAIVTSQPDKSVKIVKGSSTREISLYNLEKVMEARMTEIVDYVWREIRETGLRSKLSAGIVLTGGTANMRRIAELFQNITGLEVRVASAEVGIDAEQAELVAGNDLTLAISLLLRGAKDGACPVLNMRSNVPATPVAEPVKPVVKMQQQSEETQNQDEDDEPGDIPSGSKRSRFISWFNKKLQKAFRNPDEDMEDLLDKDDSVEKDNEDDF